MPDGQALGNDFVNKLWKRLVISQQRIPHTNQAATLIEAVKAVGAQLITANPMSVANALTGEDNALCWFIACIVRIAPLWDFNKGQFVGVLSAIDFILNFTKLYI